MNRSRFWLPAFAAVFLAAVNSAFAFGFEGHQTIAELARMDLNPRARAAVVRILGNDQLAFAATWLDEVREQAKYHKGGPEVQDFMRRNPGASSWHFVNTPVGVAYAPDGPFASENDIVHALWRAIDVLEGRDGSLTQAEALRVVLHLIGDEAQPLHVTSGWYDVSDLEHPLLVQDPEGHPGDAGGNALLYTQSQNLHSLLDTGVVREIAHNGDFRALAATLSGYPYTEAHPPGGPKDWALYWLADSERVSAAIYSQLRFGPAVLSDNRGRVTLKHITVYLPPSFKRDATRVMEGQIVKAGHRLALVLNSIQWAE